MLKNKNIKEKKEEKQLSNKKNNILNIIKKAILVIAFLSILLLIILQFVYSAKLVNNISEHIEISYVTIGKIGYILLSILVICILSKIDEVSKKYKKILFALGIVASIALQIFLILYIRDIDVVVAVDQESIYTSASEEFKGIGMSDDNKYYMATYPHQLGVMRMYRLLFKMFGTDSYGVWLGFNILCNSIIIYMITKIGRLIAKKYNGNSSIPAILILLFLPLPMLVTFIYGDIPSLMLSTVATYLILLYVKNSKLNASNGEEEAEEKEEKNKKSNFKYLLIAAILMMFACIVRKNTTIIVIAQTMFLIFCLLEKISMYINTYKKDITNKESKEANELDKLKKDAKTDIIKNVVGILLLLTLTIVVPKIYNNMLIEKYNLKDIRDAYTIKGYLYMAMMESPRANGWYNNDVAAPGRKQKDAAKEFYEEKLKERISYMLSHKRYAIDFYIKKLVSTWNENTYTAIWNNVDLWLYTRTEEENTCNPIYKNNVQVKEGLEKIEKPLAIMQKAILIYILTSLLIVIIKGLKSKKVDNEILLFALIITGGMYFHMLWETKSRYIIPYIVLAIPVTSMVSNVGISDKIKTIFSKKGLEKKKISEKEKN